MTRPDSRIEVVRHYPGMWHVLVDGHRVSYHYTEHAARKAAQKIAKAKKGDDK